MADAGAGKSALGMRRAGSGRFSAGEDGDGGADLAAMIRDEHVGDSNPCPPSGVKEGLCDLLMHTWGG